MRTGAFRGPGKTYTIGTLPYIACGERHTKHAVRIFSTPKCAREPFGVLGKRTQFEHSLISHVARDTQNTRSGYQDANSAHGSLSGSWENSHKSFSPKSRICRIYTKHTVRIPKAPTRTREPFGVLGKRTQFEHAIISDVQDSHKYHGQDYSRPKLYSERHLAGANPREGCRFRALMRPKKLSIHEKPVNCPGLYSASVKIIIKIAVFRASLVTNSHKTHGGR